MMLHTRLLVSFSFLVTNMVSFSNGFSAVPLGYNLRAQNFFERRSVPEFVDAEFEPVVAESATKESTADETPPNSSSKTTDEPILKSSSVIDLAVEGNNTTFPFIDPETHSAVMCRVAMTLDVDNQCYAVGVPEEPGVLAVIQRNNDEDMEYINPDDDDNQELLEIMAGALQKYLGKELQLKRTPRVLTVAGGLDKYIDELPDRLVGDDATRLENVVNEEPSEDEIDKLFEFFRKQFGDEGYEQVMKEAEEADNDPDFVEFMKLFEKNENAENKPPDVDQLVEDLESELLHDGVGVKLVGFKINDKESDAFYSLVKPLKPLTLIGRLHSGSGQDDEFVLLSPDEEAIVTPMLEKTCKDDIEKSGIALP